MKSFLLVFLSFSSLVYGQAAASTVRFHTNLGDIDVVLAPDAAPLTVANFLSYIAKGAYTNSIFHRSVPGFIIQGGGFNLLNHTPTATPADPAVTNEFKISNTRGTISMAKLGSDPNSATNQWFFNLGDNSGNLDSQNGGFTVFGRVTAAASLAVLDRVASLPINPTGLQSPYDAIPIYNYKSGPLADANYVVVSSIVYLPTTTSAGVVSAASYGASGTNGVAPGEIVTIFGSGLGPTQLATLQLDLNGVVSKTLGGTTVTFDGIAAPIVYSSFGQTSVIAPLSLDGKSTTRVIVTYNGTQGAPLQIPVIPTNPAVFTLNSSGTGDGAIVHLDGSVVNASKPAAVGETVILYGQGQGMMNPALPDGVLVDISSLPRPLAGTKLLIDGQFMPTLYAGGSPSQVEALLQVNFTVPQLAAGTHSIQLQIGSVTSPTGVTFVTK